MDSNKNQDFASVTEYLESIKGAMLLSFYVKVKNKLMDTYSKEAIHPFIDTVNEFLEKKEIREDLHKYGLFLDDDYHCLIALRGTLQIAIINDGVC